MSAAGVVIEFGARRTADGWVPTVRCGGEGPADVTVRAQDRDYAWAEALRTAEACARHYAGDWVVRLVPAGDDNPGYTAREASPPPELVWCDVTCQWLPPREPLPWMWEEIEGDPSPSCMWDNLAPK